MSSISMGNLLDWNVKRLSFPFYISLMAERAKAPVLTVSARFESPPLQFFLCLQKNYINCVIISVFLDEGDGHTFVCDFTIRFFAVQIMSFFNWDFLRYRKFTRKCLQKLFLELTLNFETKSLLWVFDKMHCFELKPLQIFLKGNPRLSLKKCILYNFPFGTMFSRHSVAEIWPRKELKMMRKIIFRWNSVLNF